MRRVLALLLAFVVIAAACGSDDEAAPEEEAPATTAAADDADGSDGDAGDDDADDAGADTDGAAATTTTAEPVELTASSRGVTETEIHVGGVGLDYDQLVAFGLDFTPVPTVELYDAWAAAQNERGGIHGRDLVMNTQLILPVGSAPDDLCLLFGEDEDTFAVIGTLLNTQMSCYWEDYDIPYIGLFGWRASFLEPARGLMITTEIANADQRIGGVTQMVADGEFDGYNVGLWWENPADAEFADLVRPILEDAGVNIVAEGEVGDFGQDTVAADASEDAVMERFIAEGVDFVLALSNIIPPVEAVERAGAAGDIRIGYTNGQVADIFVIGDAVASEEALANTFAITTFKPDPDGYLEDPDFQVCLAEYDAMFPDEPLDLDDIEVIQPMFNACRAFRLLVLSLEAAGPNPTPELWVDGTNNLGTFDLPGMPDASIDADKRAAGSFLARYEWDSARGAHRISGDPFPIAN